jgi:hypothetical protein
MAISNAIQRGSFVYLYDQQGRQLCAINAGNTAKGDGLQGYTGSSVNIRKGNFVYTYNEKGRQTGYVHVR